MEFFRIFLAIFCNFSSKLDKKWAKFTPKSWLGEGDIFTPKFLLLLHQQFCFFCTKFSNLEKDFLEKNWCKTKQQIGVKISKTNLV